MIPPGAARTLALVKKELRSWINSFALYGIAAFFLFFVSVWFYFLRQFFAADAVSLRPFFSAFPFAFVLVIPALTMKAWTEEKKTGSGEILFTLPFTEWELVWGKFLSCFTVLSAMLVLTLPVPLSLLPLGFFDAGVIAAEYAGALLLAAAAAALGLFFSSVSKSQALSFTGSALALLAAMLANRFVSGLPRGLADAVNFFSLSFHFESFSRGILDSRDLFFFIFAAAFFLFLNTQVLVFRRWNRG